MADAFGPRLPGDLSRQSFEENHRIAASGSQPAEEGVTFAGAPGAEVPPVLFEAVEVARAFDDGPLRQDAERHSGQDGGPTAVADLRHIAVEHVYQAGVVSL